MEGAKLRRRPRWVAWIPRVWVAVAGVFVLWQSFTYTGLSASAAEWQFNIFGFYNPALTFLTLVAILSSPLLLLRLRRERRDRTPSAQLSFEAQCNQAIRSTTRWLKTLVGLALLAIGAAAVVLMFTLFLPQDSGPSTRVVISDEAAPPVLGAVELSGRLLTDATAVFNEDFFITRRNSRFAPIVGVDTDRTILHFFVELPPEAAAARPAGASVQRGVLRQGGMPGALIRLYRYAGYRVDPNYYVLFASEASMRRSYVTNAIELLILGCFVFLLTGLCAFRRSRLRKLVLRP